MVVLSRRVQERELLQSSLGQGPANHLLDRTSHQFLLQECRLRMRYQMGLCLEVLELREGAAESSLELWTVCGSYHLVCVMGAREALRARSRLAL